MEDQEAIEKLRQCRSLCHHLAGLEEGGVELSEADHHSFAGFREVYHTLVKLDYSSGESKKPAIADGEKRLEGLAMAAGLSRAELVMLVSLLALQSPQASSKELTSSPDRKRRRRGGRVEH